MDNRNQSLDALDSAESAVLTKAPSQESKRRAFAADHWVIHKLLGRLGNPPIEVELANGDVITTTSASPVARVRFLDRRALPELMVNLDPGFGDLYTAGRIEVEGDFVGFLQLLFRDNRTVNRLAWLGRPLRWFKPSRFNTLSGSRKNINRHYDLSNDFYRLWLDEQMVYTCAYYPTPETNLFEAQVAKMDHVARKVRLRPGQSVIEAGCGWGALSLHMARHYGVKVRAFNISREQIAFARQQAKAQGLDDRVEFIDDDYRNIRGTCDAFVSVGMLEHVGVENYRELGSVISRCLKPEGMGLIHSVGRNHPSPMSPWMEQRIFPGAYVPALSEITGIFEPFKLSILDVENIRLHYAKTLQHWLERFDRVTDQVRTMFDEQFIRMWRLYLISSIAGFNCGLMQLFQIVFARASNNAIPWTRVDLYARRAES